MSGHTIPAGTSIGSYRIDGVLGEGGMGVVYRAFDTRPRPLFQWPGGATYEPSADGQRFLTDVVVSDASPISVILNWKAPAR